MKERNIDPRQQFSKKLAGRVEWFWMGYMLILAVVMILEPQSALPAFYLGCLVTGVMMIAFFCYTKNSINEKWFYWANEIVKSLNLKRNRRDKEESSDEESDMNEDEGGGNG